MNGNSSMFSTLAPFALSVSKGERRFFQQPARSRDPCKNNVNDRHDFFKAETLGRSRPA